jgi:hypothetical protein
MEHVKLLNELVYLVNRKPKEQWELMSFYSEVKMLAEKYQQINFKLTSNGKIKDQLFIPTDWIKVEEENGITKVVVQSRLNTEK